MIVIVCCLVAPLVHQSESSYSHSSPSQSHTLTPSPQTESAGLSSAKFKLGTDSYILLFHSIYSWAASVGYDQNENQTPPTQPSDIRPPRDLL